jgi:hypothetical protein
MQYIHIAVPELNIDELQAFHEAEMEAHCQMGMASGSGGQTGYGKGDKRYIRTVEAKDWLHPVVQWYVNYWIEKGKLVEILASDEYNRPWTALTTN